VDQVDAYDAQASRDQESLEQICRQKLDEQRALIRASEELLTEEKSALTEAVKQMDNLGAKLEYELSTLQSKVEDFETGVAEFERQVLQVELKEKELVEEFTEQFSWFWWAFGFFIADTKRGT
jgi:predicted nuclease with TOPRIM domain